MHIRPLSIAILIIFIPALSFYAQTKTCDLKLSVFSVQQAENPLSVPLENATATLVNLSDNKATATQMINGKPYFSKLPEGQYNIVVSKSGYLRTSKPLWLNCRIIDEKKIYDEIVFMNAGDSNKSVRTDFAELSVDQSPPPPPPPGTSPKNFESGKTYVQSSFLNERAVYLPAPILTAEGKETSDYYKKNRGIFLVKVYVIGDESGNVTATFYTEDNRFDKKLFPDILEKAKQAKFLPFKLDGKPVTFSGIIIYSF